ncbi:DUF2752 domain-containing protein [Pedobacter sp. BMA]|uniref:DUF2752 domain-containing protein n=1 Tax=Pedobacter sp. BMA TaxID=1663685 RepID=UPI00064B3B47|nr:DUF2752 domain-containing protein [Pedobacter sp. BMA]KLT65218.1 hypothetical protein AB669_16205 [Pedobacter sp. BMA]
MANHNSLADWLSHHLFACPVKAYFGFDCPGCGFQRSVISLFKGNIAESFRFYPATMPILFLAVFAIIHLSMDVKTGASIIKIAYAGIAIIILINYIYKISTHQLIS